MSETFTAVTCPECRTGQEIPPATPTRCLSCGAEIDAVPGEYMTVIPAHAIAELNRPNRPTGHG